MFEKRVIPCLQMIGGTLVKTVKFKDDFTYIGDPLNTCRIFNELEVDEMILLDIRASVEKREPNYSLLSQLAGECFMPLAYGGGINSFEQAKRILGFGFEKIIINSLQFQNTAIIESISNAFGRQSVVISIDIKKNLLGQYDIYSHSGRKKEKKGIIEWIEYIQSVGIGEIIVTDIDREGTWSGYNLELFHRIVEHSTVPIIAHGGAGSKRDIEDVINIANVSAAAVGSMVVFQEKDMGVLINYQHDYNFV